MSFSWENKKEIYPILEYRIPIIKKVKKKKFNLLSIENDFLHIELREKRKLVNYLLSYVSDYTITTSRNTQHFLWNTSGTRQ